MLTFPLNEYKSLNYFLLSEPCSYSEQYTIIMNHTLRSNVESVLI